MAWKPTIGGKIGVEPPAHAPKETSQPLTTEALEAQMRAARANERELPPFAPDPAQQIAVPGPAARETGPPAVELTESDAIAAADAAFGALHAAKSGEIARPRVDPVPAAPPAPLPPAASDSESPSRGIPKAVSDPNKAITGGFGVAAAAGAGDYIPLDGSELCTLAQGLLIDLAERLSRDLRFSIAVTYPRVRCRVELIVESFMVDSDFRVQTAVAERGETPLALARALGDEIVFVVVNQRQEVDASGRSESPANAIRGELGIEVPRKQVIQTPTGTVVVDRRN